MKNLRSYEDFLKESKLPYEIVQYGLSNKAWNEDKDKLSEFKEKNPKYDNVKVYSCKDKNRDREYTFYAWKSGGFLSIQLTEDERVIFSEKYDVDEKIYFDQDCHEILGFSA